MSGREKTTRLTSGAANETQALESGGALQGWIRRDFAQPLGYFGLRGHDGQDVRLLEAI